MHCIPAANFYSASEGGSTAKVSWRPPPSKSPRKRRPLRRVQRRVVHHGVRHRVRRPATRVRLLDMAAKLMDESPLNDYIADFMKTPQREPDCSLRLPDRQLPLPLSPQDDLYPLFRKDFRPDPDVFSAPKPKIFKKKLIPNDDNQYIIDAGQKHFGATQCNECGVIYQIGDSKDEEKHMTYHLNLDVLKFNGWKNERTCARWGEGRAVAVHPGDSTAHWQKVNELLERVVHPELGFADALKSDKDYTVYLYVEEKRIQGCLVAERLKRAYKLMRFKEVDCCGRREYPVKCGVSRLWVHHESRHRGIASKLVTAARAHFLYGHVLACDEMAFSSPTPAGRAFVEAYTGTPDFFVYLN